MGLDLAKELDQMAAKIAQVPDPLRVRRDSEGKDFSFGLCLNVTGGGPCTRARNRQTMQ